MSMNDINSLSHTKWNCKCHIVFAPKFRRKVLWREESRNREGITAAMRMERGKDNRGRSVSGSHTFICCLHEPFRVENMVDMRGFIRYNVRVER